MSLYFLLFPHFSVLGHNRLAGMSTLSTSIQYGDSSLSQSNKIREENKRGTNRKIMSKNILICRLYDSM